MDRKSLRMLMHKRKIAVMTLVYIAFFSSCYQNNRYTTKQIEGIYYTVHEIEGEIVFGFISFKNGQYINNHGLYRDLGRSNVYRKPYHPEIFTYQLKNNNLFIEDTSNSYEVGKLSLTRSTIKQSVPRYKIRNNMMGVIYLENPDLHQIYTRCDNLL